MTTDREQPSVVFWATVVLVVVLVGYPLSFGPACWASSWDDRGNKILPAIYRPILRFMSSNVRSRKLSRFDRNYASSRSEGRLDGIMNSYAKALAKDGACWYYTIVCSQDHGKAYVTREEWDWLR